MTHRMSKIFFSVLLKTKRNDISMRNEKKNTTTATRTTNIVNHYRRDQITPYCLPTSLSIFKESRRKEKIPENFNRKISCWWNFN